MQKVINYLINQCEINKNKKSNNNSTILDCTDYNIIQIIIKENHSQTDEITKFEKSTQTEELNDNLKFIKNNLNNEYVLNDLEAAKKLIKLYPYWRYCENKLYVFNFEFGLWSDDDNIQRRIIEKFEDQLLIPQKNKGVNKSYGNDTVLIEKLIKKIKSNIPIDDNWKNNAYEYSLGKLLFKNGYYDLKTNKFYKDFNPDFGFVGNIQHDYMKFSKEDEEYMESIKRRLFYEPLGKEVGDYFILNLARGLAGDRMKKIFFGLGNSNTGKTTITRALLKTCGDYVCTFDGNNLVYKNSNSDLASQNRWLMLLKDKRLIFANEINTTKTLNGNLIKSISSGGDALTGRNHSGNENNFYLSFLIIVFANDLPSIVPYDDAVSNRVRVITYDKKYSDEPDEYQLKSDPNIDKEFETLNFQRCFIEIFIRQYWKWMNGDFKYEPTQVIQAKQDWMGDKIGCLAFFQEEYEITNNENDFISLTEIQEWLKKKKNGITMSKFVMEIKQHIQKNKLSNVKYGEKKINNINKKVWFGIIKIDS